MTQLLLRRFLVLVAVMVLAGCTSAGRKNGDTEAAVEDRAGRSGSQAQQTEQPSAEHYPIDGSGDPTFNQLDDEDARSVRVIYFDYDQTDIKSEYRQTVQAHATYLANRPDIVVTLEGHADERGSREYNLALGETRANAVRRQMVLLGASAAQLRTVSYGEERPLSDEHDEAAWALNRRVEIQY